MPDAPLDRLAADATRLAGDRRRVPRATYRLQMHAGFPIATARQIVGYLDSLGISHAYTSSLLTAKPGSTHGYDVQNHETLNPELGGDGDFAAWVAELHGRGMGLLLDTVPNHMCVTCDNAWWFDVLENGPASPYASYFDIAWQDHPRERLRGKVLLPILGETYGKMLASGEFKPAFEAGAFFIRLGSFRLPVDPRTYGVILGPVVDAAKEELKPEEPALLELLSILNAVKHLSPREESDPERVAAARIEAAVIKRRLAELSERYPAMAGHIARAVERLAGVPGDSASFAALDQLLEAQAYRPSFWRVASDEINYRRFFDVNDLAALSTEREEVFRAIHKKIFEWLGSGAADGLRIDHPDGLYDPKQYLDRLQVHYRLTWAKHLLETKPADYEGLTWDAATGPLQARFEAEPAGHPLYVVVEKILAHNEPLPPDWASDGTTGYEFLNAISGLFVDSRREQAMTDVYQTFTWVDDPFDEVVYRKKFLILQSSLSSELHMLAHQLDRLAQAERWSRDFTLNGLRHALREVIACFPVYRSYVDGTVHDADRTVISRAVRKARARNPLLGRQVFEFIRDTLLLKDPPSGLLTPEYRAAQCRFVGKFQQVTSPVMAKGVEDTSYYVFNRLLSLNEVGSDPRHFGVSPTKLHRYFRERADRFPAALSPLATHDTKRGEDVRARINALSEVPEEWGRRLIHWAELNRPHKIELEDGLLVPDANEEYFLYQTLVGAWPIEGSAEVEHATFVERIQAYMNKAMHEAKVHTSWINPNAEYDAAVQQFIAAVLDRERSGAFLDDLSEFQRDLSERGMFNSLAQTLLRIMAPGVPDTYQGTELWDLSLVDPDNRRPVDYALRARWLDELDQRAQTDRRGLLRDLVASKADGRIKLYATSRALRLRRDHPGLFAGGRYESLESAGPRAEHLFGFIRVAGNVAVLVAVPRLLVELGDPMAADWQDTGLRLPEAFADQRWLRVFGGGELTGRAGMLTATDLFAEFPVALLVSAP